MVRTHLPASFVLLFSAALTCGTQALAATATADSAKPSATVSLAAQCIQGAITAETRADLARHDRLIEQALRVAPSFAPARWQSGQVRYADQWMTIDSALEKGAQDDLLQRYRKLRSESSNLPGGQLKLARWCQQNHLTEETRAHALQVLAERSEDPKVLKMLDFTWYKGELITTAELAKRKERDEHAKQAMRHWRPLLVAIRDKIESQSAGENEEGLGELRAIHDPASIEALVAVFKDRPALLCEAVRVIGQFPSQEATDALLEQAVLSKNNGVRLAACHELKARSMYGYVPKLMASLSTPIETKFDVFRDRQGVHFRETIQREGASAKIAKTVDTNVTLLVPNPNLGSIILATYAEVASDMSRTAKKATRYNRKVLERNDSIYPVLENTVGSVAPNDPEAWWNWWRDYTVTTTSEKPVRVATYYQYVDVPYVPVPMRQQPFARHNSCFASGTIVWTLDGPMPIEKVQIGDRVLSQSPRSGELTFKAVLDITLGNQEFLAVETTAGQRLVATRGHLFWVSGAGWRMTKQLQAGDRLHTVSGWSEIKSLEPVDAGETHNLVVADFNTYFVGDDRVLTHDVTMPQMVTGGVPGELAAR